MKHNRKEKAKAAWLVEAAVWQAWREASAKAWKAEEEAWREDEDEETEEKTGD